MKHLDTAILEEQERRAYADGNVAVAALLVRALQGDDDTRADLDYAQDEQRRLQREVDDLGGDLSEAEDRVAALEAEAKRVREKVMAAFL